MAQTSAPEVELFYPDGLMAGFTAKRQHRKLSEKARRDRMKTALKGLSDVMSHRACPEAAGGALHQDINGNSQSKEVAGKSSEHSDRVSVVEAATLYIYELQKKLAETNHRLDEASHSGMTNLVKKTNM
jgi:Helix-loop-helix DNA-binding domain.